MTAILQTGSFLPSIQAAAFFAIVREKGLKEATAGLDTRKTLDSPFRVHAHFDTSKLRIRQ